LRALASGCAGLLLRVGCRKLTPEDVKVIRAAAGRR
jgi:hypothetical protein